MQDIILTDEIILILRKSHRTQENKIRYIYKHFDFWSVNWRYVFLRFSLILFILQYPFFSKGSALHIRKNL